MSLNRSPGRVSSVRWMRLLVCASSFVFVVTTHAAQGTGSSPVEQRLEQIEQTLKLLSSQMADLTSRLRPTQPSSPIEQVPGVVMSLKSAHRAGAEGAKVAIVEFSDFQCPFCARHANGPYREVVKQYVDSGRVQYAFRHLPLEQIHPLARHWHGLPALGP